MTRRQIYDFERRLEALIDALYRMRRLEKPTVTELSRISGVNASTFSHAKNPARPLSGDVLLRLHETVGVRPEYFTTEKIEFDVLHYIDDPNDLPHAANASGDFPPAVPELPVKTSMSAEELKLLILEVAIERKDLPEVRLALFKTIPPPGRETDLVWWIIAYENAREAARETPAP